VLLILFGYGVSFDMDHLPVAVIDDDHSRTSRGLTERLFASGEFERIESACLTPDRADALFTTRVAAAVLDGAIGAGTTFLAFGDQPVTVPFIGTAFQPTSVEGVPTSSWTDSGWVIGAVLLVIVMQAYLGVTPGKIVLGIAVVDERDARPVGLVRTTVRSLLHVIDAILFIGYLRPLWNARHKTFADSIMATVVLNTRRPRRHYWFAPGGDSLVDPGPPRSWEAPLARRWWLAATAICAVAWAGGVLFSLASSGSGPLAISCEMTAPDDGPLGLIGGDVERVGPRRIGF